MSISVDHPISVTLIAWYDDNKRQLPWRETSDPYLIWVSEIILQQTRVAQGLDYYNRFVQAFPTVKDLASAPLEQLLHLWQGLGYYSRARNMHIAAQQIVARFGGNFPTIYTDILQLKGVGVYTAAAIASFAYHLPYAVVDGNVYRVLSRLFDLSQPIDSPTGKKLFASLAQELLSLKTPHLHNQAIMEFGALQCTPSSPQCLQCPLQSSCVAFNNHTVSLRPIKEGKTKITVRYFNYLHITCNGNTWIKKREGNDIWRELWEYPLVETPQAIDSQQVGEELMPLLHGGGAIDLKGVFMAKHQLTHRTIYAQFYTIEVEKEPLAMHDYLLIKEEEMVDYPLSRLMQRYLDSI